ncbi:MAG: Fic family protein [Proteobacteria bacterium]|nr:Fic family protein [Pseudomonadota bacterium]MBS0493331.1 Fic family protein [Pseudomonadota bacterium]
MTPGSTPPSPSRPRYLWQQPGWPALVVDGAVLAPALESARVEQGRLLGLLDAIGWMPAQEVARDLWAQEALATAQIEGQRFELQAVRSSVARRLGLEDAQASAPDRSVEGLVDVMQDAVAQCAAPLDADRLWRWQSALFPGGTSGIQRIAVGRWRDHADPMQIVSGPLGREVVHYEAPPSHQVAAEMGWFLAWFESTRPTAPGAPSAGSAGLNGLVRAALVHLWFETVHPFEDGNGRLGRALADMALAQDLAHRQAALQPFSAPIFGVAHRMLVNRGAYYDALNAAQRGSTDVTAWVLWFVQTFVQGCIASQAVVRQAVDKAAFRIRMAQTGVNPRQAKVLERLLAAGSVQLGGGFLGGLTADKYTKLASTSKPTATRDLADLVVKGLLQVSGQGKATRYSIAVPGWTQPTVE